MASAKKEIEEWLGNFEWGDDESGMWKKANENGATILLEQLLEYGVFITIGRR
jgi:hypothetical protein